MPLFYFDVGETFRPADGKETVPPHGSARDMLVSIMRRGRAAPEELRTFVEADAPEVKNVREQQKD